MKKTEFYGYVYDFSVDYDAIALDDILDIHDYLIKSNNILARQQYKFCFDFFFFFFFFFFFYSNDAFWLQCIKV